MQDASRDQGDEDRLFRLESEVAAGRSRQEELRLLAVQQSWRLRRTRSAIVDLKRVVYGVAVLCGAASLGAVLVLIWVAP